MTEIKKVVITDRFSSEASLMLTSQAYLQIQRSPTPDLNDFDLSDVHALVIRSRTQVNEALLARAKKLQVIVTATSGFDHIDLTACEKWGITVMFTPNANIESAAQLTWGLVLACANKIPQAHRSLKSGEWNREPLLGIELFGKTMGIVGLGRIGCRVAEMAQAFGMRVLAFDPYIDDSQFVEAGAERVAYEELLKRSEVLSFHVPKTSETNFMLNRSQFEYIHRGIILINASRGSVIKELDLLDALDAGYIGAVGLDVFEKEPLPRQSRLFNFSNVVLTPHVGANTTEAFQKASDQAAMKIMRFFVDSSTSDVLPPKAAWYGARAPWKDAES